MINFISKDKKISFQTNPIKVMDTEILHYWGDLHGLSEETIGTGSAEEYFNFAKNRSFLDVSGHQGNDFQITKKFWKELNVITKKYNNNNIHPTAAKSAVIEVIDVCLHEVIDVCLYG